MNQRTRNRLALLLILSIFTIPAFAGQKHIQRGVGAMTGTWQIQVIAEPGAPFVEVTNLATIDRKGRMVNVDPELGSSVGEVFRLGARKYGIGFWGFINQGGFIIRYEVQANAKQVDQDSFSGEFNQTFRTLSGNNLGGWSGRIEGTRLIPGAF